MAALSVRRASCLALFAGVALVAFSISADWLLDQPHRFGPGQVSMTALGAFLAVAGILLRIAPGALARWRRVAAGTAPLYRWLAFLTFNVLALLLLLELALAVVTGDTFIPVPQHQPWREVSYYHSQDWAPGLFAEYSQLELEYQPYTMWRTKPFSGNHIEVTAAGDRRTVASSVDPDALEVLAIGGSGMWGIGSPDWGTIPSYLQQQLAARLETPVRVVNMAERGYVSTQGLVRLMLELQSGRVPDMVVFYDGFNDVAVAGSGLPGDHYGRSRIAGRLDRPLWTLLLTSRSAELARKPLSRPPSFPPLKDPDQLELFNKRTVESYLSNYDQVDALSRKFGFSYCFFWQPTVVTTGKPLAPYERIQRESTAPELAALFHGVYDAIAEAARGREHLVTLASTLDDEEGLLFVDMVHLGPPGNEIIASAMAAVVAEALSVRLDDGDPPPR